MKKPTNKNVRIYYDVPSRKYVAYFFYDGRYITNVKSNRKNILINLKRKYYGGTINKVKDIKI